MLSPPLLQAEDRAHRIGQSSCVNVHLLVAKDTIDEMMWDTLQAKLHTTGRLLDGEAAHLQVGVGGYGSIWT